MKNRILILIFISMLLTLVQITCASAAEPELNVSDGAEGDNFNRPVSISGNYAIMGAFGDDGGCTGSGRSIGVRSCVTSMPELLATEVQMDIPVIDNMATWVGTLTEDNEAFEIGVNTDTDESTPAQTEKKGITIFILAGIILGVIILRIVNELLFNLFLNI